MIEVVSKVVLVLEFFSNALTAVEQVIRKTCIGVKILKQGQLVGPISQLLKGMRDVRLYAINLIANRPMNVPYLLIQCQKETLLVLRSEFYHEKLTLSVIRI